MPTYEPGDFVKAEFSDETTGIGEWMWVRVRSCDEKPRLIFGWLDNTPLKDSPKRLKPGAELAISFDKIRDHKKATDFGNKH